MELPGTPPGTGPTDGGLPLLPPPLFLLPPRFLLLLLLLLGVAEGFFLAGLLPIRAALAFE